MTEYGSALLGMEGLGLDTKQLSALESILHEPSGIVLFTGAAGSGQSTTLHASLVYLYHKGRKILTMEDPHAFGIPGVTRIQIQPETGLTFVRTLLRYDPGVLMIGSLRDEETARRAVQAVLAGHVVISTLQADDAGAGLERLQALGVSSYFIAASVRCLVSQRQVRMICEHCRCLDRVTPQLEATIRKETGKCGPLVLFRGAGCEHCGNTGYGGLNTVFSILRIDEEIRRLLMNDTPVAKLAEVVTAIARQDGWDKVLQGITTAEEMTKKGRDTSTPL